MNDTYPNPWAFNNLDNALTSPDGFYKIVYDDRLGEIAMGAPLGGRCVLESQGQGQFVIPYYCAGPPAWETNSKYVAIPVWVDKFFRGRVQQLAIIDAERKELKLFSKIFRVLDLRSFHEDVVYSYDSPIRKTTPVTFDIQKEKISRIVSLSKNGL